MIIEEKDINATCHYLSKKFAQGDKWVVYSTDEKSENLLCFKDINAAHRYCSSVNPDDFYMGIKPIINVLRELTGAAEKHKGDVDLKQLTNLIHQHPLKAYHQDQDVIDNLADGGYHPVLLQKQVRPFADVPQYHIVEHTHQGMIYETNHDVEIKKPALASYQEADTAFKQLIDFYSDKKFIQPDIKLVGSLKNQDLILDVEGDPMNGSGILFKRAYPRPSSETEKGYDTYNINDPYRTIQIEQPALVKYNRLVSGMDFFDGKLLKLPPGTANPSMHLDFLSQHPVQISKSQALTVGQNNVLEEKQNNHSLKQKGLL